MPALTTQLDPRSQDFLDNAAFHRELVAELDRRLARAADGGGRHPGKTILLGRPAAGARVARRWHRER